MKKILIIFISIFIMNFCVTSGETSNIILKDESSIKKFKNEEGDELIEYINTTYSEELLVIDKKLEEFFVKRKHIIKKYPFTDNEDSTIIIDLYPLSFDKTKSVLNLKHEVNDIKFEVDYYLTIYYGCCAMGNYYELYKYKNKEAFLKFDSDSYKIEIPNSPINAFIGFFSNRSIKFDEKNNGSVGFLYFSTADGILYTIEFLDNDRNCFGGIIKAELENEKDEIRSENTYVENIVLWSARAETDIKSTEKKNRTLDNINNVKIKVILFSIDNITEEETEIEIVIPIVNGSFFGDKKVYQKYMVKNKTWVGLKIINI